MYDTHIKLITPEYIMSVQHYHFLLNLTIYMLSIYMLFILQAA